MKCRVKLLCSLTIVFFLYCVSLCESQQKYKVCVVESFNKPKKSSVYCSYLEQQDSEAQCVIGYSRIDCLRQIWKGKADFGAFQPEDLVAVANLKIDDIVVINSIRAYPELPFQTQLAAVIRKDINVTNLTELRGHKFCHPGYGYDPNTWTAIMARFFEATVVPQSCDPALSIVENHINSSSGYFKAACKAGPWVRDPEMDSKLKQKYFNLCELCDEPESCSTFDKYWGTTGPLYCLTDGVGDIAWAHLEDIDYHFGIHSHVQPVPEAQDYDLFCPDGGHEPLDTPQHCTWLSRPWPAIVSRKKHSQSIQKLVSSLKEGTSHSWKWGLRHLLESFTQAILPLDRIVSPDDYLRLAPGFVTATNLGLCNNPPRDIKFCTKSNAEVGKCNLLKEAASAYGIEPPLSCIRMESTDECIKAVNNDTADIVVTEPDTEESAHKKFSLESLLYESPSNTSDFYKVSAITRKTSTITSIADLKGKKACFTAFDSVGWTTMVYLLSSSNLISGSCPYAYAISEFFSEACVPGIEASATNNAPNLESICEGNATTEGELQAFKCLAQHKGDVAFIDMHTVLENTDNKNNESWAIDLKSSDFRSMCFGNETSNCYLSWATPGQIMIHSGIPTVKRDDILFALLEMGNLFGKHEKTKAGSFLMFGPYDNQKNILFHDVSASLETYECLKKAKIMRHSYEDMTKNLLPCSSAVNVMASFSIFSIVIIVSLCL